MLDLLQTLEQSLSDGRAVAYTALVETRGSTPQKAGATMLVFADGSQVGTLGGGCVEAEVKRRALRLLDDGGPEILTFQLDNDYGWDDGLICGGRMKMLVDPLRPTDDISYYQELRTTISAGRGCTEIIIVESDKAGGQATDRHLFDYDGQTIASRSIDSVSDTALANLKPVKTRPRPYVADGASYLTHLQSCRLIIVGGGHVGQRVAELAADVDFDVWVVDDREQYCNQDRFPFASRLIVGPVDTSLSGLDVDENTLAIIVTRGHNHDEEALYHLAETNARYVGMIGSRRKIKLIFEDLLREGISREALSRVHAPLGFEIGSQTVTEIAVSILAELIAGRNLAEIPDQYVRPSLVDEISIKAAEPKSE